MGGYTRGYLSAQATLVARPPTPFPPHLASVVECLEARREEEGEGNGLWCRCGRESKSEIEDKRPRDWGRAMETVSLLTVPGVKRMRDEAMEMERQAKRSRVSQGWLKVGPVIVSALILDQFTEYMCIPQPSNPLSFSHFLSLFFIYLKSSDVPASTSRSLYISHCITTI